MSELGPVSAVLEAAVREEARQHGIVVWLDREGSYTRYADGLCARAGAGGFPHPVRCLRGSYLELMHGLAGLEDGVGMTPLLIHVPGHTPESIADTPLYELYCAGRRYWRALPTLVREAAHGRATPEATERFLGGAEVSLEAADRWLTALSAAPDDDEPDLGEVSAEELYDRLARGELDDRVAGAARGLWRKIEALAGLDATWRATADPIVTGRDVADELAAWALCVEFVHDLKRAPTDPRLDALRILPRPASEACKRLARHLRERCAGDYARIADETEARLAREIEGATAADLGKIDTFRFEDQKVMAAALAALESAHYGDALAFTAERTRGKSFWCAQVHGRRIAWHLIEMAAQLGREVADQGNLLAGVGSLDQAVERYAERGWKVDRAHRVLEQARQQIPMLEIEEIGPLRARLDEVRRVYRGWADDLSQSWNLLAARVGPLPTAELQQRTLFDEVVAPLVGEGVTAYVMVDALRFEMGAQLRDAIGDGSAAEVVLRPRLAELPSVTEMGMNALAPVVRDGKLAVDIDGDTIRGIRAGGLRVDDPEKRRKVIHERVGGTRCPRLSLEEVLHRDVTSLRQAIAGARVVVVHADGIDRAGEKGMGLAVFEQELQNLRAAWRLLQEAGVRRFVITADHGFLLHDPITRAPQAHGKQTDPDARYAISPHFVEEAREVTIASRDLGYDGDPVWFQFPASIAPFDRGKKVKDFAHGGPSPQERVIPVLVVQHRHAPGSETVRYRLELTAADPVGGGMHCLRAAVRSTGQASLSYGGRAELELAFECVEDPDVQVELCGARDARTTGGSVFAGVERPFELLFRLSGPTDRRVGVRVRHATRAANVEPADSEVRYQVEVRGKPAPAPAAARDEDWLLELPAGGVRDVLRHLATYGAIDEGTAKTMLGGGRGYRAFCVALDATYRSKLPFAVRIETGSGTKVYVRGDR